MEEEVVLLSPLLSSLSQGQKSPLLHQLDGPDSTTSTTTTTIYLPCRRKEKKKKGFLFYLSDRVLSPLSAPFLHLRDVLLVSLLLLYYYYRTDAMYTTTPEAGCFSRRFCVARREREREKKIF